MIKVRTFLLGRNGNGFTRGRIVNAQKAARRARRVAGGLVASILCLGGFMMVEVVPASASPITGAGYGATPPFGLASASATFKVPTITCPSDDVQQLMGVFDAGGDLFAGISSSCSGSTPTYEFYDFVNGSSNVKSGVKPGDVVVTSMSQTGNKEATEVHDITSGAYWYAYAPPNPDSTIYVGLDDLCVSSSFSCPDPVIQFTKTKFSNVQINGDYLSFEKPTQYDETSGSKTLVATSNIGSPGDNFTLTFKASG
ncbi:MAG TPA: hypothetical protein VEJ87_13145 [Acidimicrobiales bacterium]|nr:hypothetical protein [Acidimicrobiales bacterium]